MRKKLIVLIVLIGVMGFIYYMSAQPVLQSGAMSFGVDRWVCSHFVEGFDEMTLQEQESMVLSLDFWVRKSAHAAEYMTLGAVLMMAVYMFYSGSRVSDDRKGNRSRRLRISLRSSAVLAIAVGGVYAVLDEMHQYFVPGRACQLRDMIIDICGVTAGVIIAACALWIKKKLRRAGD